MTAIQTETPTGPREQRGAPARDGHPPRTELREVRAADPHLSPETNERLTQELREVIGATRVEVPVDRPHAAEGEHPARHGVGAFFSTNRLAIFFSLAVALTFGAIVALTTADWWFLVLAAGIHAIGTATLMFMTIRITTISEHPSPMVAAAMTEEGVHSPDERFSEMVDEFRPQAQTEGDLGELLAQGYNDRTVPAGQQPAAAGAEQSTAWTPTSQPSRTAPRWGTPDFLLWAFAAFLALASIAIPPAFGGGWMWLTAAVMVPMVAGWALFQWVMIRHPERTHVRSMRPIVITIVGTVAAVAICCALIALAYHGVNNH